MTAYNNEYKSFLLAQMYAMVWSFRGGKPEPPEKITSCALFIIVYNEQRVQLDKTR